MNVASVRLLQRLLDEDGHEPGPVDGRLGPRTHAAVLRALGGRDDLPDGWSGWSDRRRAVLYLQCRCLDADIHAGPLDGLWGPQTDYAVGQLGHVHEHGHREPPWRDQVPGESNPHAWPVDEPAALAAHYGTPGDALVMLDLPYPLRLSWQLSTIVARTQCHTHVRDSLRAVLDDVLTHYGRDGIRELRLDIYGGGYHHRERRGGTTLSTHAWGIAFDFDPERNRLRWGRDRAAFAHPDYDAWWHCWESHGWLSLGRHRNFDWMHVQAARL